MSSFCRGGVGCAGSAAYGCSNAYDKRKPGVGFFSVSEAADAVSREVECL